MFFFKLFKDYQSAYETVNFLRLCVGKTEIVAAASECRGLLIDLSVSYNCFSILFL